MKLLTALVALALLGVPVAVIGDASADAAKARLGRQMFAAFQCATFAELADKEAEQNRLFELGYARGRASKKAVPQGVIALLNTAEAALGE